jgi:hypothetical protein
MTTTGYCWRRSNGLLLFGLTTAFLFAMAQICGVGRGCGFFEV